MAKRCIHNMYIHCICRCTPAACEFIYPVSRTTCIYPYPSADPPIMFANIPEENEDIPLISFDQSTQLGGHTTALDSTTDPLADGYVTGGGGSEFQVTHSDNGLQWFREQPTALVCFSFSLSHSSSRHLPTTHTHIPDHTLSPSSHYCCYCYALSSSFPCPP